MQQLVPGATHNEQKKKKRKNTVNNKAKPNKTVCGILIICILIKKYQYPKVCKHMHSNITVQKHNNDIQYVRVLNLLYMQT